MATGSRPELDIEPSPSFTDEPLYEVIDGQVVEMPPMGSYPVEVASILFEHLGPFVKKAGLGRGIIEVLFRIDAKTQYRPDLAYISYEKWPKGRRAPKTQPWEIVPDLAVEVISKNDEAWEVIEKVHRYFQVGVRGVWLVHPNLEIIHVYESFTQIRVLTRDDELDGGAIIPGFRLPLTSLFEEETEEQGANPAP